MPRGREAASVGPVREPGLLWLLTRLHPELGPVISRWWPEVFIYRKELEPGLLISIPSVPLCLSPAPCPDLTLKGEITSGSPSSSPLRPLVPAIFNAVSSHLGAVSSLRVGLLPHRHPPCPPSLQRAPSQQQACLHPQPGPCSLREAHPGWQHRTRPRSCSSPWCRQWWQVGGEAASSLVGWTGHGVRAQATPHPQTLLPFQGRE